MQQTRAPSDASSMAQLAFHLDPTDPGALRVLGRIAYDEGRFVEAAKRLEPVISVLEGMELSESAEVARLYIEALVKGGSAEKAMIMIDGLRRFFSDDAPNRKPAALAGFHQFAQAFQNIYGVVKS